VTLNSKSLIKKVKFETFKVKFQKLNSTILQSFIFMNRTGVLRKLGQASPRQLEYGMQIQAPLNSPSLQGHWVCSLQHVFSLQSFD